MHRLDSASRPPRPGLGALLLVVSAGLFAALAADLAAHGPLSLFDLQVTAWLQRRATPAATQVLLVITHLHSTIFISLYAAAVAVFLYTAQRWRALVTLFVCVAGGLTLNVLMKLAFHRVRPIMEHPILTLSSYSFPSGHVVGTTLLYGLGVVAVFASTSSVLWRLLAVLGAGGVITLVALSRTYLGVHHLTDVLAAFAEGVAWLAFCLSAIEMLWRDRDRARLGTATAGRTDGAAPHRP